jgi:hypothetical protein
MLATCGFQTSAVSHMLVLINIDDANGALRVALRAVAKPGLAIEL